MSNIFKQLSNKVTSVFRRDSWINRSTGFGLLDGRVGNTQVRSSIALSYQTLSEMYYGNGLAKRIVNCFVDDALRNGFLECADEEVKKAFKRLGIPKLVKEACYFSRLYGGSMIVAFLDDGLELSSPISEKRINKIINFRVFDKSQISWTDDDLNKNYLSTNFGKPDFYNISSLNLSVEAPNIRVHESRCKILDGVTTSHFKRHSNAGWGDSVLQACFDSLRYYGIMNEGSAEIINDFIQVIIKMNGLSDKLMQENGAQEIAMRAYSLDTSRSNANLILLDAENEDYEKKASSISGLSDLWDRFSESICAATGYPITRLFGRSPGGLNSTGTSDLTNYYDLVSAYRSDAIEPIIDWMINLLVNQTEWVGTKDIEWSFASLVEHTPLENAQLEEIYSKIDWGYIDRGAIDASEAWQERFGQGEFKKNIILKAPKVDDSLSQENIEILETMMVAPKKAEKKETELEKKTRKVIDSLFESI
jgi:phage-related protein (TIGR01555 family)